MLVYPNNVVAPPVGLEPKTDGDIPANAPFFLFYLIFAFSVGSSRIFSFCFFSLAFSSNVMSKCSVSRGPFHSPMSLAITLFRLLNS